MEDAETESVDSQQLPAQALDGARFILDAPPGVPAVWGEGSRVLWSEGEALMIAGPQGVGKTTLAGMLLRGLLGIGGPVLGLSVAEYPRVLYLAMDRPRQIARAFARVFDEEDRETLTERLAVWPGPPPVDLARNPRALTKVADQFGADVVLLDSLKDAALGLSEDEVGASYNRARQLLLGSGRQLAELHHVVKRGPDGKPVSSISGIYGSTWLTSGAGSVVLLTGEPGDPIVGFRHLKQPAEEVGPYRLLHDQSAGTLTVEHTVDLLAVVRACGVDGLTAKAAAVAMTEKSSPSRADVEKARRKLEHLTAEGLLVRLGGDAEKAPVAWFLAEKRAL